MAIVKSNSLVAAAQARQREVVRGLARQPRLGVLRFVDPANMDRYRPTGSYNMQIRGHAGAIGVRATVHTVYPTSSESVVETVRRLVHDPFYDGVMPLYPLAKRREEEKDIHEAVKAELAQRPKADTDDLLGRRRCVPTASAMFAMGNLMLHPAEYKGDTEYFEGRRLDELRRLSLPKHVTPAQIVVGGRGELTMGPGLGLLEDQGIFLDESQIITHLSTHRWSELPEQALILTATPVAGQIRSENVHPGSVIADAGFGIIDGQLYGNADLDIADRNDVLWTPPQRGIGPVSTTYLYQELLYACGLEPSDFAPLSAMPMEDAAMANARWN
ncbi:MAG TPA: hypothetical protein VFM05_05970 [Candidatus Saccharimonadales bacterium]|nr:hypothetical protein [Candidatus Saccharimonadales bacterium]